MKNLFSNIKIKMLVKSLVANGSAKNIALKVGGNALIIGEINFSSNESGEKFNLNLDKAAGGGLEFSGNHDCKIEIKGLSIMGEGGEEFHMELLELNSIAEAMEIFASIAK